MNYSIACDTIKHNSPASAIHVYSYKKISYERAYGIKTWFQGRLQLRPLHCSTSRELHVATMIEILMCHYRVIIPLLLFCFTTCRKDHRSRRHLTYKFFFNIES